MTRSRPDVQSSNTHLPTFFSNIKSLLIKLGHIL